MKMSLADVKPGWAELTISLSCEENVGRMRNMNKNDLKVQINKSMLSLKYVWLY